MRQPSPIARVFQRLRREGRTGLVTYVTAGDPDAERSAAIIRALDRAGADILEIGVPFSDPMADGPVIQRATERALAAGTTLARVLDLIERLRADVTAPIVVFSYANPVFRMGLHAFAQRARAAGVNGVLLLDLPVEEAGEAHAVFDASELDTIFLLSPTTTTERIARAAAMGRGFLYGISRLGVTGARDEVAADAKALVERMRARTDLPIALGFGISRPEHVAEVGRWADAAVVGSALVSVIAEHGSRDTLVPAVEGFVRWLKGAAA
ncbi:MAG TPA: tryptophan synthase subunit alpha, partial [Vicinamibacterales bacterium]|nr:tryptophan synthase subunit alpha [Vicinamibacterales bacterium]